MSETHRWALAIETSNPSAATGDASDPSVRLAPGVAVAPLIGDGHIGEISVEVLRQDANAGDDLLPAIDRAAAARGFEPGALSLVAVSIGPGGFTSLRVAVTVGTMLAKATGAALRGVPSALVVALSGSNAVRRCPGRVGIALASKGASTHLTIIEPRGQEAGRDAVAHDAQSLAALGPQARLVEAVDLAELALHTLVADRFLPLPVREAAQALGCVVVEPRLDPGACLRLALASAASPVARGADLPLRPIYAREPEAVTKWRERHGLPGPNPS
mgnify:CR=1 FL=1